MGDLLPLGLDELLTTTRAVRRRLDLGRPVPIELVMECIGVAQQAPVGGNSEIWHFVVVTDTAKKQALGDLYAKAFAVYRQAPIYPTHLAGAHRAQGTQQRVADSAAYLAEHLAEAPLLVIPCVETVVKGVPLPPATALGSVLPAAWSFMLAARARGLGTCWTTLHLMHEAEAAAVLGIPDGIAQAMLTPVAFTVGTSFRAADRPDPAKITHINSW